VLARDLTCPHPAITVTADNVRLNLGGHTLTGSEGFGAARRGTEKATLWQHHRGPAG
jgi:predicted kinase